MTVSVAGLRGLYGAALLIVPIEDDATRRFCRVLGARQLAEAAFLRRPTFSRRLAGAAVDGLHAVSVLWLARRRPDRAAALHGNAAVAASLAITSLAGAVRQSRSASSTIRPSGPRR